MADHVNSLNKTVETNKNLTSALKEELKEVEDKENVLKVSKSCPSSLKNMVVNQENKDQLVARISFKVSTGSLIPSLLK